MKINKSYESLSCDVLVIGSGGAGAQAAEASAEEGLKVIVISKDPMSSSDTKICEGVITVRQVGSEDDSEEVLSNNIKLAGGDLPDKILTDAFAKDSKKAYDRLRNNGLRPSINKNKPKVMAMAMGGHNKSRSVGHKNSGLAFGHTNWDTITKHKNIDYLEDAWFLEVATSNSEFSKKNIKKVVGGVVYDATRGKIICINAKATIIAAGGLSTLFFPKTDTMRGNTGDSYSIGMRAEADMLDMEQIQFLPFCIASPPSYEGLLAGEPATASFLGVLRDKNNNIILDSVYLRTRAQCSEAIMRAVADGRGSPNGGAFLDMTLNKKAKKSGKYFMEYVKKALPSAFNNARQALGKEAAKINIPWEVRPSAHYMMGGIRVDDNCRAISSKKSNSEVNYIPGLYAAGQAMGGLFGANRLGSTSLTELTVFGYRAGKAAAKYCKKAEFKQEKVFEVLHKKYEKIFNKKGKEKAYKLKIELQKESWKNIGPARTKTNLEKMLTFLKLIESRVKNVSVAKDKVWNQQFIDLIELNNMIITAKAVTLASLERNNSLGGHVRLDCKSLSVFSKPFSTILRTKNNTFSIGRTNRTKTNLIVMVKYLIKEKVRILNAKLIRYLPMRFKDSIIEKKI